jgi:DNA-binding MarR family transcriptional regulator
VTTDTTQDFDSESTTSKVYDVLREAYANGETSPFGHGVRVHTIADRLPNSEKNVLNHLAILRERGLAEQTIEMGDQGPGLCGYRPIDNDGDGSVKPKK